MNRYVQISYYGFERFDSSQHSLAIRDKNVLDEIQPKYYKFQTTFSNKTHFYAKFVKLLVSSGVKTYYTVTGDNFKLPHSQFMKVCPYLFADLPISMNERFSQIEKIIASECCVII